MLQNKLKFSKWSLRENCHGGKENSRDMNVLNFDKHYS